MTSPSTSSSSTTPLFALALAMVGLAVVGGIVGQRPPAAEGAPAALTRSPPPPPPLPPPPLPTLEEIAEAQAEGRDLDPEASDSEEPAPVESASHELYTGTVELQGGGLTVTDEDGVVILRVSPDDLRRAQVVEDAFAPTVDKRVLVLADGSRVALPPDLGRGALPRTVEYGRAPPDGAQPE